MSKQISKSLFVFYEIVSFLSYREKLRMQLISRKFYEIIVPNNIQTSSVRSASHARGQDRLYHYASGYIMFRQLSDVVKDIENEHPGRNIQQWQYMLPSNQQYVHENGLNKQLKFGRTVYIPYNKVLVISGENIDQEGLNGPVNDVFTYCLITNTVEKMPNINFGRSSFAAHYDFGDRFVYVIGGCDDQGKIMRQCEKFDVFNQKWTEMPKLNVERGNPGSFISEDRRYLYVFQGFKNTSSSQNNMGYTGNCEALDMIERLDLWNEKAGWQIHQLSQNREGITKQLRPKGCFTMFNMNEFDYNCFTENSGSLTHGNIQRNEESKEEEQQINSYQVGNKDATSAAQQQQQFNQNTQRYKLHDKVIIFGGWQPYQNIEEIEILDSKSNNIEDVLPLALNMRGQPCEAMKSIQFQKQLLSVSTTHESNNSSDEFDSDSDYSDEINDIEENSQPNPMESNQNISAFNRMQIVNSLSHNFSNLNIRDMQSSSNSPTLPGQSHLVQSSSSDISEFEIPAENDGINEHPQIATGPNMEIDGNHANIEIADIEQIRRNDKQYRKLIYLQEGDKITKKPLQFGKYLILLGRMHIQVFNVQNFTSKILRYHGEDYAEKMGQTLKRIQLEAMQQENKQTEAYKYRQQLMKQNMKQNQASSGTNLQAHQQVTRHYLFRVFQSNNQ